MKKYIKPEVLLKEMNIQSVMIITSLNDQQGQGTEGGFGKNGIWEEDV